MASGVQRVQPVPTVPVELCAREPEQMAQQQLAIGVDGGHAVAVDVGAAQGFSRAHRHDP